MKIENEDLTQQLSPEIESTLINDITKSFDELDSERITQLNDIKTIQDTISIVYNIIRNYRK